MQGLSGDLVNLRAPEPADAEDLLRILGEPATARWWPPHELADVERDFIDGDRGWTIEAEGDVAGWLEFDEHTDPMYRWVGLDILLTSSLHGRGHAREALRLAIRHFIAAGHHRFTIDPAGGNARAIGAYAAVGFKPVGLMRDYERGNDGKWHDGLLMDLLADELIG